MAEKEQKTSAQFITKPKNHSIVYATFTLRFMPCGVFNLFESIRYENTNLVIKIVPSSPKNNYGSQWVNEM
jgi:hypothetical protein